ncbi:hypothetical protein BH11PSE3_BH11PSE3_32220 [soil metagenome]
MKMIRMLRCGLIAIGCLAALPSQAQDAVQTWSLPSAGLLNGSKAALEEGPCCGASRGAVTIKDSDATVLATLSGRASRDGKVLRLKLAGNRALRLTDCDEPACEGDNTRLHRLATWLPKHRLYVVTVGLYEESVAYLVAEQDGRTLVTTAPPVLSPSGRQAVALVSNLMSGVDLEIIDFGREPATVTKVTTMPDCSGSGPNSFLRPIPRWIDDSHVTFDGDPPLPEENPNAKQLLRVDGNKSEWQC